MWKIVYPSSDRRSLRRSRTRSILIGLLSLGPLIGLFLMIEAQAQAYVDPGSGLFTLQILGASFAGGLFFLRQKLRKLFARGHKAQEKESSQPK